MKFVVFALKVGRPWAERIFWMIAFVISTIGCALLIAEVSSH